MRWATTTIFDRLPLAQHQYIVVPVLIEEVSEGTQRTQRDVVLAYDDLESR